MPIVWSTGWVEIASLGCVDIVGRRAVGRGEGGKGGKMGEKTEERNRREQKKTKVGD